MSESLTVEIDRYLQRVSEQRNTALDEAAKWQALAEQMIEENKALREENGRLREKAS